MFCPLVTCVHAVAERARRLSEARMESMILRRGFIGGGLTTYADSCGFILRQGTEDKIILPRYRGSQKRIYAGGLTFPGRDSDTRSVCPAPLRWWAYSGLSNRDIAPPDY